MPVRTLFFNKIAPPPQRGKNFNTPIHKTEEWAEVARVFGSGMPPNQYLCVEAPHNNPLMRAYRDPVQAFLGAVKRTIKERKLAFAAYAKEGHIYILPPNYSEAAK